MTQRGLANSFAHSRAIQMHSRRRRSSKTFCRRIRRWYMTWANSRPILDQGSGVPWQRARSQGLGCTRVPVPTDCRAIQTGCRAIQTDCRTGQSGSSITSREALLGAEKVAFGLKGFLTPRSTPRSASAPRVRETGIQPPGSEGLERELYLRHQRAWGLCARRSKQIAERGLGAKC